MWRGAEQPGNKYQARASGTGLLLTTRDLSSAADSQTPSSFNLKLVQYFKANLKPSLSLPLKNCINQKNALSFGAGGLTDSKSSLGPRRNGLPFRTMQYQETENNQL